jgi:hypothetical protein
MLVDLCTVVEWISMTFDELLLVLCFRTALIMIESGHCSRNTVGPPGVSVRKNSMTISLIQMLGKVRNTKNQAMSCLNRKSIWMPSLVTLMP